MVHAFFSGAHAVTEATGLSLKISYLATSAAILVASHKFRLRFSLPRLFINIAVVNTVLIFISFIVAGIKADA